MSRIVVLMLSLLFLVSCSKNEEVKIKRTKKTEEIYQANWESLSKHNETPEWFTDAKFGIYFHWGVYSVPAYGSEWYPWNMYKKGSSEYEHHREIYGAQEEFGYHKFVPQFTAEKFNADEWVSLFKKAGAKFAGPVAQHHDGFAMWKSTVNPWNSFNKGPKRDITGEIAAAVRKSDIKLITTFHHSRNLQRYADDEKNWGGFNSHFIYNPKYDTSTTDPELSLLYGNISEDLFLNNWSEQINEVITQYKPDMIWFDAWLNYIPEKRVQQMCADYFNTEKETKQEVLIGYKQADLPKEVGVLDIEQGGRKDITDKPWMTDITLSNKSWSYVKGQTYKNSALVIRNLIDVVSKNGVVLLNVSPKADGTIPDEQKKVLLEMGDWFSKFGEAIYNTKPYTLFGFGNAVVEEGHFGGQSASIKYTENDIRFTQSKDEKQLYMFFLGEPIKGKTISYRLLAKHRYGPGPDVKIKSITLLDSGKKLDYSYSTDVLNITIPEDVELNSIANVIKFDLE
ncbi:alpha-L-fucosidase [Polaribacter staleyi]|uniref:alpha-L-fucosidase n=1 Tax=Polaribacter staleyi TaxID=2022337 RepID=UPI0031BB3EEE